jgi:hypothetical protein
MIVRDFPPNKEGREKGRRASEECSNESPPHDPLGLLYREMREVAVEGSIILRVAFMN